MPKTFDTGRRDVAADTVLGFANAVKGGDRDGSERLFQEIVEKMCGEPCPWYALRQLRDITEGGTK